MDPRLNNSNNMAQNENRSRRTQLADKHQHHSTVQMPPPTVQSNTPWYHHRASPLTSLLETQVGHWPMSRVQSNDGHDKTNHWVIWIETVNERAVTNEAALEHIESYFAITHCGFHSE